MGNKKLAAGMLSLALLLTDAVRRQRIRPQLKEIRIRKRRNS
ncbi:hypothetical protein [Paenibacillus sp. sptzw28]|nr:hypothetical protein [Paenibacillus sp. sptzw28]